MSDNYSNHALITIHGIKSDNKGLEELIRHCCRRLPGLVSYRVTYGMMGLNIKNEYIRTNCIEIVEKELEILYNRMETERDLFPHGGQTKLYVVAHSFGTFALFKYIEKRLQKLRFNEIIFVGSIVPAHADWDDIVSKDRDFTPEAPINIVRPFDLIVKYGKKLHNSRSVSGSRGFVHRRSHIACDHFKIGGHTGYNPSDFDDIANIIKGTFDRNVAITELEFLSRLSFSQRIKLNMLRRIGFC